MSRTAILVALTLLLAPSLAVALEVATTWSTPRLYGYPPPADLTLEGSVRVTFTGDQAMTPADPAGMIRINDHTWSAVHAWDATGPWTVVFLPDGGGAPDTVTAVRAPARPLDLSHHDGLVLTADTERPHLWSPETGIYVWGLHENCLQRGEEWERQAQLVAHAPPGVVVWQEPIGLRINGQSSRYHVRKGLRAYFDDHGTSDHLTADLFGDGPGRFARLVLKSTVLTSGMISSSLWEPLHQDLGHLGSRHRLAGLYLDGEYWGAYSVRERLDDEFVEVTHELADGGAYTLIKDDEAAEGDVQEWYDFLAAHAVPPQDYGAHQWYTAVQERLDLDAYMDWMYLNIHGASSDNGWVNNVALLRVHGGPWRYLMWDEEGLMAEANLLSDHFRFYAAADFDEFEEFRPPEWSMGNWWPPHQPWRDLFRGLMQNSEFKARFSARIDQLVAGPLSVASLHARLDSLAAAHALEVSNHAERWNLGAGQYAAEIQRVRQWLADRAPIVAAQKVAFFEHFAVPVELSRFDAAAAAAGARLTWRTERERDNAGFQVWRARSGPDQLALLADWRDHAGLQGAPDSDTPREYAFTDSTLAPGERAWYQLRHESTDGAVTAVAWIERVGPPDLPGLRLNELMADNDGVIADEAGEFDDWLELFNPGPDAVSLAGLALADDPDDPAPWPLPPLDLGAGQFLLVWCDEDPGQGPLHADFKLSADGESATLFLQDDGDLHVIDSVTFGPQATDVAFGRLPDGDGPWQVLATATPGASNGDPPTAAPAAAAGLELAGIAPNPTAGTAAIRFATGARAAGSVMVAVYDLRGRLVRQWRREGLATGEHSVVWDRRDRAGRRAPTGTYLVRVTAGGQTATAKLSVVR